ncbi:MAG: acetate/propionate family kinase [Candidatus Omnitrophica bacterium]|nr:acetate/propionate family kinase [Candidatus Omnitrophota bacterium]
MNILVFQSGYRYLDYTFYSVDQKQPVFSGRVSGRDTVLNPSILSANLKQLKEKIEADSSIDPPEAIAIRVPFGGETFRAPVKINDRHYAELEKLYSQAPLHISALLLLIRSFRELLPSLPIICVFETSFFIDLPAREHRYGLNPDIAQAMSIRRYGFHGIYHQNAVLFAARQCKKQGREKPSRVLSICLNAIPEVTAVLNSSPLTVTSGMTPLEGLPGHTTCGELDPSIMLQLHREKKWGPEHLNRVLTQESGLSGLYGAPTSLKIVFTSDDPGHQKIREFISYRILLACGAGVAALGGLDAVVFSGHFSDLGEILGPWLKERLHLHQQDFSWHCCPTPLYELVANEAVSVILQENMQQKVS